MLSGVPRKLGPVLPCVNAKDRDIGTLGRDPLENSSAEICHQGGREHLVFFLIFFPRLLHPKYLKLRNIQPGLLAVSAISPRRLPSPDTHLHN